MGPGASWGGVLGSGLEVDVLLRGGGTPLPETLVLLGGILPPSPKVVLLLRWGVEPVKRV